MHEGITNEGAGMNCKCMHHKFVPGFLILIAVAFLLKAYGILSAGVVDVAWPILLGLIGVAKWTGHGCKCNAGHCEGGKCC